MEDDVVSIEALEDAADTTHDTQNGSDLGLDQHNNRSTVQVPTPTATDTGAGTAATEPGSQPPVGSASPGESSPPTTNNSGSRTQESSTIAEILSLHPELYDSFADLHKHTRATGTLTNYSRIQKDFQTFCGNHDYEFPVFSEKAVAHYIGHLNKNRVGLQFLTNVKPALQLIQDLKVTNGCALTPLVINLTKSSKRMAADRKPPTQKMDELSHDDMKRLMRVHIQPYLQNTNKIPVTTMRTMFRAIIEHFTLCRFHDFEHLKAHHFEIRDEFHIEVTYLTAKNDQMHNGNSSVMSACQGILDPVWFTKLFFDRFKLRFNSANNDTSWVSFRTIDQNGFKKPVFHERVAYSTALDELKLLCAQAGLGHKRIGEKSAKMGGVTWCRDQGMTPKEIQNLGRWKTCNIIDHYMVNSLDYKKRLAHKMNAKI